MDTQLCHRTRSTVISSSCGAIHRGLRGGGYQALGRRPDPEEPWRPQIFTVQATSPVLAYEHLVQLTGRPWGVGMLEPDLDELAPDVLEQMRTTIPALRIISTFVLARASQSGRTCASRTKP